MTEHTPPSDHARPDAPARPQRGGHTAARLALSHINVLQEGYVGGDRPTAASRAGLAQLRRGVGKPPGEIADLVRYLAGLDASYHGWQLERGEIAVHTALTCYAVHQQSRTDVRMHDVRRSFGSALGMIRLRPGVQKDRPDNEEAGVVSRYEALATATSINEVTGHLRALVGLLRDRQVGFDYGGLVEDLYDYPDPARAAKVRLRWGRDFYRAQPDTTTGTEEQS